MRYPILQAGAVNRHRNAFVSTVAYPCSMSLASMEYFLPFFVMVKALGSTKVLIYPEVRTGAIKKLSP